MDILCQINSMVKAAISSRAGSSAVKPKSFTKGRLIVPSSPPVGRAHVGVPAAKKPTFIRGRLVRPASESTTAGHVQPPSHAAGNTTGGNGRKVHSVCELCGRVFYGPDPKWSNGEKTAWMKNLGIEVPRHARLCALANRPRDRPVSKEEAREAFNGIGQQQASSAQRDKRQGGPTMANKEGM